MIDLRVSDPIVVDNHGDVMIFHTADAAQEYMEPIDIENGEYEVHDAGGNRLDIFVTETGRIPTVTLRTVLEGCPNLKEWGRSFAVFFSASGGMPAQFTVPLFESFSRCPQSTQRDNRAA